MDEYYKAAIGSPTRSFEYLYDAAVSEVARERLERELERARELFTMNSRGKTASGDRMGGSKGKGESSNPAEADGQ
eukprot:3855255-Heterocapsa_arctica.AAC.1